MRNIYALASGGRFQTDLNSSTKQWLQQNQLSSFKLSSPSLRISEIQRPALLLCRAALATNICLLCRSLTACSLLQSRESALSHALHANSLSTRRRMAPAADQNAGRRAAVVDQAQSFIQWCIFGIPMRLSQPATAQASLTSLLARSGRCIGQATLEKHQQPSIIPPP